MSEASGESRRSGGGEASGDPRRSNSGEAPPRVSQCLLLCLLLLVTAALAPAGARGEAPAGPRLAVAVTRPYPQHDGIETVGPLGEERQLIVGGGGERAVHPHGDRPVWSPDGSLLAFTSSFGEYSPVIYLVGAGGGRPRLLSKTTPLSEPIFSPDGRSLVFSVLRVVKGEFRRPARRSDDDYGVIVDWAVLAIAVRSGAPRLLTPWRRNQVIIPTSFSPDGSKLAAERVTTREGAVDAVAVELESGRTAMLARNAREPVYVPDGSRIAFVRTRYRAPSHPGGDASASSDLFVMPAGGGKPVQLARIKGGLAWPSWDPSGQRIAFTRLGGGTLGDLSHPQEGNAVMQINADGTCLTKVISDPELTLYGSAWQPGPGREAGSIACADPGA